MKKHLILIMFMAVFATAINAQNYSVAKYKATKELCQKLQQSGLDAFINEADQSVVFDKNGQHFWITVEGTQHPLRYILNTQDLNLPTNKNITENEQRDILARTLNALSTQTNVKTNFSSNRVYFFLPTYASSAQEYAKTLSCYIDEFRGIEKKFDQAYDAEAKAYFGSKPAVTVSTANTNVNNNAVKVDANKVVIAQPAEAAPVYCKGNVTLSDFAIRVVNPNGAQISPYNTSIRKSNCVMIQEKITVTADQAGKYAFNVRIYNPKGKLMLPSADAQYTTSTIYDIRTPKKPVEIELKKFGYTKPNSWEPGEYTIEFLSNNKVIFKDTFHVL